MIKTHVRELESGGVIRVALGTALHNALKESKSRTFVAYVKFDEGGGTDWLIAFQSELNAAAESWGSLGKEGGNLRFYPGSGFVGSGSPSGGVWGLAVATFNQSTGQAKFYFYNFNTATLAELGVGSTGQTMSWSSTPPARVQFGEWNAEEQFNGKYAAAAIFGGVAMTPTEIKALAAAASVEAWASLEPTGLWIFDQAGSGEKVTDVMGHGADQGSIGQGSTSYVEVEVPLALRGEGEPEPPEEHPGAEKPTFVGVKGEGGLEAVKRYVKTGAGLVELT